MAHKYFGRLSTSLKITGITGSQLIMHEIYLLLLFFRNFRTPEWYSYILKEKGVTQINVEYIDLESPFALISAQKIALTFIQPTFGAFMNNFRIALFIICFLSSPLYSSSINAVGEIATNTQWSADTITINDDVTINNGVTLTIAAGTFIEFNGHFKIDIKGTILAEGTIGDSIIFTAPDTATGWAGLRFDSTSSTNDSSVFSYCRFQYGRATGTDKDKFGGALFCYYFSRLKISNSLFTHCSCSGYKSYGGAFYFNNSSPIITNTTISSNKGSWGGGGIYCTNRSSLQLININLNSNSADQGGAIYCDSASPRLIDVIIIGNHAVKGSGIYCSNSSPDISGSTFSKNNYSGAATVSGGGICSVSHSLPVVKNSIFTENNSSWGGGIYCNNSSIILTNTLIVNNSGVSGGGICLVSSTATITGCPIVGNHAVSGGGLFCHSSSLPTIINSTISINSADSTGGGIFALTSSSPSLKNTILYFNNSGSGIDELTLADTSAGADFSFCDIRGGSESFRGSGGGTKFKGGFSNNITNDPLFIDTTNLLFYLKSTSPCINAANPDTSNLGLPLQDIAGNLRFFDSKIDIGAFEFNLPNVITKKILQSNHNYAILSCKTNFGLKNIPINLQINEGNGTDVHSVCISLFTIEGRQIRILFKGILKSGSHTTNWDYTDLAGKLVSKGNYLCKATVDNIKAAALLIPAVR
jgi:predicted outer membrane repeat protein